MKTNPSSYTVVALNEINIDSYMTYDFKWVV